MSEAEMEEWSKREGWSLEYAKKHADFKTGNRGVQIEFELMDSAAPNSYESNEDPEAVKTEEYEVAADEYEVEISSNSKGLAGALTNPTEIAKRKGNIDKSYPITYGGTLYKDVEEAYQRLKDKTEARKKPKKEDSRNYRLMVDLITAKLNQFPELVDQIKEKGGSEWILNAVHQPTNKGTVWETEGQNWFIEALNDAFSGIKPKDPAQTALFEDEHLAINAFYNTLNAEQKKKLGKLEDLIDQYEQLTYSSEEDYIQALKCKL
jgi:hypothetical protein